jgi:hypothetical protein
MLTTLLGMPNFGARHTEEGRGVAAGHSLAIRATPATINPGVRCWQAVLRHSVLVYAAATAQAVRRNPRAQIALYGSCACVAPPAYLIWHWSAAPNRAT